MRENPADGTVRQESCDVTGAGGGIGRAMVVRLAEEGAQVVAAIVSEERVAETAELAGATCEVVDIFRPQEIERLVATAVDRHGKLTTMCNNAVPALLAAGGGSIVNTGSVNSLVSAFMTGSAFVIDGGMTAR